MLSITGALLFVNGCAVIPQNQPDTPPSLAKATAQESISNSTTTPGNQQSINRTSTTDIIISDPFQAYAERKSNMTDTQITGSAETALTKISQTIIGGASLWLFAVPDENERIALSAEKNGNLLMALTEDENPSSAPPWKEVVTKEEIGSQIADHWHIFAHGYHWIVFSVQEARTAYLAKIDTTLQRISLKKIVDQYTLGAEDITEQQQENTLVTNDMFLVEEPTGVTAGFVLPGYGHKLFRFDNDMKLKETKNIGGGEWAHANGSSAIPYKEGFALFAVDQMNVVAQGGVRLFLYDADWNITSATTLLDFDNTNIGMASGIFLPNGELILHARANDKAYPRGVLPPPPKPGERLPNDGGNIVRYIFDKEGALAKQEILYQGNQDGNRPHTSVLGNNLFTTWDAKNIVLRRDGL